MRPEWLWTLLPALLLCVLLWRARKHSGGWSNVIAPELLPYLIGENAHKKAPNFLPFILLAWCIAAISASGPSWEQIPQPIHQKQDAMVLVLDLSYSMKAGDLAPSRLDRARQKLLDLLSLRREGQTGLVAYAGDSHIVTPLTDDHQTIANLLPALSPDMMPLPGSNTGAAIGQAIDLMHSAGVAGGQIILVTDGVDSRSQADIAKLIRGTGMTLSVLGVGTPNGAPIPLPRGGFLKDDKGTIAIPKLDVVALESLAANSSGRYLNIQIDDSDLNLILNESLLPTSEQTQALNRTADTWEDKGYLLTLLLLPFALGAFRKGWLLALVSVMLLAQPEGAMAQSWEDLWLTPDQQGQRAMAAGDIESAAALFENPEWAGTAAYRSEDFEAAEQYFSAAETASSLYNKGNALARSGKLDDAIAAYEQSLELQPEATDAAENLELIKKLKEQQEQQQQQQEDDGESSDENKQDKSDQQAESQSQSAPESSEDEQDSEPGGEPSPGEGEPGKDNPPDQDETESPSQPEPEPGQEDAPEQAEKPDQPTDSEEQKAASAQAEEASDQNKEEEQAMQQWLRRIPDDPSGLLREKFRYESQQRQEQGGGKRHEIY